MTIKVYERSFRAETCARLLEESESIKRFERVIILPIPSTKDGEYVSGCDISLEDALADADTETLVIGYGIPKDVRDELGSRGTTVCDSLLDEEFLCENGELTACAALGIILTSEKRVPADMKIGIVGYGRIGKRLMRLLLYLGARVTVYTTREDVRLELCECGVASEMSIADAKLDGLDLLVNTAPAQIFDTAPDGAFPHTLRIIDLASGENFPGIETVEKYPSVPARMFPHSAGRIWFMSIERYLSPDENFDVGGGA